MLSASRFFASPVPYATWAGLVIVGLAITWPIDPYLFGLATLISGVGTMLVGIAGVVAQIRLEIPLASRRILAFSVTAAAIAVAVAFAMLSRINWA